MASEHFTTALIQVASSLKEKASPHGYSGHGLCHLLAEVADCLDPGAVASALGEEFADYLVVRGVPKWEASIAGWGVGRAA